MGLDRYPPVMVGIPCVDWMWVDAIEAQLALRLPPGSEVVRYRGGASIAWKRNELAKQFMADARFGSLLFLDSDMTPPPYAVERLLSHQLPIVGALYCQRRPPFAPHAAHKVIGGLRTLATLGGVQPVDYCGTGCLLVRRDMFEQIPRPWFAHSDDAPGQGEDEHFCDRAIGAGLTVHCDTAVGVGHLGVVSVDLAYATYWQKRNVSD